MSFNSLRYMVFLAAVVALYYILKPRYKNALLLLTGYFFYCCWDPRFALFLLFSTMTTYGGALLIRRQWLHRRKLWLVLTLTANLGMLCIFKYFSFTAGLLERFLTAAGLSFESPALRLLLPVGISFYTFQVSGYVIDVYRGDVNAETNLLRYALFASFFPGIVSGPIQRAGLMLPQYREVHAFDFENLKAGLLPLLWGLFKKMVLADRLAVLVDAAYAAPWDFAGLQLALAAIAYSVQIYCDFSAYTDIAAGSARMLGFRLPQNFNHPYSAVSVRDFWRRWHISLSTWFRDYLYFPLGGGRVPKGRRCLNILIVFAVSGLWHGAALTFLAWGLLHGLYQVCSDLTKPLRDSVRAALRIAEGSLALGVFRRLFTFALVTFAWIFFRAESVRSALYILARIVLHPLGGDIGSNLSPLAIGLPAAELMMLLAGVLILFLVDRAAAAGGLGSRLNRTLWPRYGVYFLLVAAILLFGSYGPGYNPQDFVYFKF